MNPAMEIRRVSLDDIRESVPGRTKRVPGEKVVLREHRYGDYEAIEGHDRVEACRKAGFQSISAHIAPAPDLDASLIDQLRRSFTTGGMTRVEQARALKQVMDDEGWTQAQVARAVSISQPQVSKLVKLLRLPMYQQAKLTDGRVSMEGALALARHA